MAAVRAEDAELGETGAVAGEDRGSSAHGEGGSGEDDAGELHFDIGWVGW